jgi:hypothetical protein
MFKKTIINFFLLALLITAFALTAHAQYSIDPDLKPINEPFDISEEVEKQGGATTATIYVLQIIAGALLYFAAPVAILIIVVGAFEIVTGGDESEKIDAGKKSITWAVVGLLLIILSYSIVRIVIDISMKTANA